jgi:hypothetical protein
MYVCMYVCTFHLQSYISDKRSTRTGNLGKWNSKDEEDQSKRERDGVF